MLRKRSQARTHHVVEEGLEPREEEKEYTMFQVTSGQIGPLHAMITVNGSPLSMEIDTGALVSIVSMKTIQQREETLELQKSAAKL